jgi:uncharacterized protein YegJ (DUF2314 family)
MGWPFFRRQPPRHRDDVLQLSIEGLRESMRFVLFGPVTNPPADPKQLKPVINAWVQTHAPEPFDQAIPEYIKRDLLQLAIVPRSEMPDIPRDFLKYHGPTQAALQRFDRATHAAVLIAHEGNGPLHFGFWTLVAAARALCSHFEGVVFDPLLMRLEKLGWDEEHIPPPGVFPIAEHIYIPYSIDRGGVVWMTTKGLSRLGLPELELRGVPPDLPPRLTPVINGMARRLIDCLDAASLDQEAAAAWNLALPAEHRIDLRDITRALPCRDESGKLVAPPADPEPDAGVRGWSVLRLEYHPPKNKDYDEFLRIVPPAHVDLEPGAWLHTVITDIFGTGEQVKLIHSSDEAMHAAHEAAIRTLPDVRKRFLKGLALGETLYVKHGFPVQNDENEYMWIAVTHWKGTRIQGTLANDPRFRADLRAGQEIVIPESEVYDWLIRDPEGNVQGNFTSRVLEREGTDLEQDDG